MPCSTSDGMGGGPSYSEVASIERRVAELEAAFCGLLKLALGTGLNLPPDAAPALRAWWAKHQQHPGHRG